MRRTLANAPQDRFPDLHPVLARVYVGRGVTDRTSLDYSLSRLCPFHTFAGIDRAVALLEEAIANHWRILVVADFDADGATSCAVTVLGLRALGAQHVEYLVPNRFKYGYGLTPEIVAVAVARRPDLLITVDNGISSIAGVEAARAQGIRVLVTDHHLPRESLPEADAIVNPNQPGCEFPSKHLAGVGVVFYVLLALRARLREAGSAAGEVNLAGLLDLVALGTVSDVVPLDDNNRVLVEQGLRRIRAGRCRPGVVALLAVAGRGRERAVAGDLSFAVGPRLNAAGRLTDMSLGIECLLAGDEARALELARRLDELNRARREIEMEMREQAESVLRGMRLGNGGGLPHGLCLYDERWHQGVVGILASRVKDRFHRPAVAFAPNGQDEIKGSARSIHGLHIRDVLEAIATRQPGLLHGFGGHAMAAGVSLHRAQFQAFRSAFEAAVSERIGEDQLQGVIYSDGALGPEDLNLDLAERLRAAGPWGQGFPEPVFDGQVEILSQRVVGGRHLKFLFGTPGDKRRIDGIGFDLSAAVGEDPGRRAHIAYRLDVNVYRGRATPQLVVEHFETLSER